jgi:hypothetical protein
MKEDSLLERIGRYGLKDVTKPVQTAVQPPVGKKRPESAEEALMRFADELDEIKRGSSSDMKEALLRFVHEQEELQQSAGGPGGSATG